MRVRVRRTATAMAAAAVPRRLIQSSLFAGRRGSGRANQKFLYATTFAGTEEECEDALELNLTAAVRDGPGRWINLLVILSILEVEEGRERV